MLKWIIGVLTKPQNAKLYLHLWYIPYVIEKELIETFDKSYDFNYQLIEQNKYGIWVRVGKFLQRRSVL